jgi:hypothetical protein
MPSFGEKGDTMGYQELYNESWDLYKKELMVNSLGSIIMGEIIKDFVDQGYYMLRLQGTKNSISCRFDRGELERVRLDVVMHQVDLGTLYSFGGICHITVWKGIQGTVAGYAGGQVKQVLSTVRGLPEPGVYMVMQDGTSYFVGTTIYFNVKDHLQVETFSLEVGSVISMVRDVLEEISRMDSSLEVVK